MNQINHFSTHSGDPVIQSGFNDLFLLGAKVELDGFLIPKNTNVYLLNFLLHRNTGSFLNPDTFNPDRYIYIQIQYRQIDTDTSNLDR